MFNFSKEGMKKCKINKLEILLILCVYEIEINYLEKVKRLFPVCLYATNACKVSRTCIIE